ncbi:MAG: PAS domain-containing protein [Myxococcaceae bacterium]
MPFLLAREQLAELFDAHPEPLCALSAVRTEQGIQDFRFVYANPAALRALRRTSAAELEGHRLLEVEPSHGPTGLFERYVQVVETGAPDRSSFFYAGQRVSGWFSSLAVRWGDGLTVSFRDESAGVTAAESLLQKPPGHSPSPARELLEAMLRHLPARVILLSLPDFVFEYVNDAFLGGTAVAGRQLIGQRAADVFPELLTHPLAEGMRRALATGKAYVNPEVPLRMDFGRGLEERIFSVVYQPVADAEGRPVAVLGFHFDVTQQAEARACTEALLREKEALAQQLEQERRWQKAVLTDVSQGLAVLATDGSSLFCNPRMEELLGRPAAAAPRMVAELFPYFSPDALAVQGSERPFHLALTQGLPVRNVPVVYPHPARGDVTLDVSVAPILDAARRVTAAIVTVDDVTERHRLERERSAALGAERDARLRAEALARDLARSEERFRSLVETSSQVIWTTDWSGRLPTPAPGWAAFTGQRPEETLGHGWLNAIHPSDVPALEQMRRQGLRTGEALSAFCRVRGPDGVWAECVVRGVPLFNEEGRVREWVGTLRDVSVERREEAALRLLSSTGAELSSTLDVAETLEAVTRLAVPALADFCIVDALREDGTRERVAVGHAKAEDAEVAEQVRRASPASGGPLSEALQRLAPVLIPVVTVKVLEAAARDASHREVLSGIQCRSLLAVPLLARGRPLGVIGFFYSHSERRYGPLDVALAQEVCRRAALAIDNAKLYQRAEEANRAKDEFLATVSHELRTPLSAILGWTRLLRGGGLSAEKHARALETLERNARVQARLVDDLLDVSRIVAGETRLEAGPVEVARVVDAALEALRPAAEAKDISLDVSLDRTLVVAGDADRLQQVTWNLLSNAIKFTPSKGRISLWLNAQGEQAQLSVADTGQGITRDFLPHVFERFRQADSTATRSTGGLGLGLAIVRHLVELHGGTVTAASEGPGQGATFTVRLALVRPGASEDAGSARLAGVRVLVVDDEAEMRELLSTVLAQAQASVTTASSAAEALEVLRRERPHLLVADVAMPGVDGYQLLARVRSLAPQHGGQTPAVALSAQSGPGESQRALRAGFQVYVTKPVEPSELVRVVAKLVSSTTTPGAEVVAGATSTG